ncbi:type II toxin-antitoxin system RelE/ParE family toxin [Nitrospira sp.]
MTQIIWSPQALRDMEAIRAYIAEDSPRVAELVVGRS